MITNRDSHAEIENALKAVEKAKDIEKVVVKLLTVIVKLLLSVRTNQVNLIRGLNSVLEKYNFEPIKLIKRPETTIKTKSE